MKRTIATGLLAVIAVSMSAVAFAAQTPGLLQADRMPRVEGAKEYYVAPDGKADNAGTKEAPWDLESALLKNKKVSPGDIIWLTEGTYGKGGATCFVCELKGTKDKPIIIRGLPGRRVTIDGGIYAKGGYTWFWGFEITNSSKVRKTSPKGRPSGLNLYPSGNRAINLIIHDTGHPGIGYWKQGEDGEVHGCLVYGCGLYDTATKRGRTWTRGSGLYSQNNEGTTHITDSIWFRNFTIGIKSYAQGGPVVGFHIEGNISFDSLHSTIFAGTTKYPVSNEVVKNNCTYNRPELVVPKNRNIMIGYGFRVTNSDFTMTDNYIVGGNPVLIARRFKKAIVTGNTFYGLQEILIDVTIPKGVRTSAYTWDNNTYIRPGGGKVKPFHLRPERGDETPVTYDFAGWKAETGLDSNSKYLAVRPKGARVFVRPNKYEVGRGHVAIYNWDLKDKVDVDLSSVLAIGAKYEIRDAQNYFGPPVVKGTYDGKSVAIPMKLTKVAPPVGKVPHTQDRYKHTAPEFAAFVVISEPVN